MNRREFIAATTAENAVGASGTSFRGSAESAAPFQLNYASEFRRFRHSADLIDQFSSWKPWCRDDDLLPSGLIGPMRVLNAVEQVCSEDC